MVVLVPREPSVQLQAAVVRRQRRSLERAPPLFSPSRDGRNRTIRRSTMQRRCSSTTSSCDSRLDSSALGPDVMENECGDGETNENPDDAVTDFIEIGIRRVSLKNADEECEGDL